MCSFFLKSSVERLLLKINAVVCRMKPSTNKEDKDPIEKSSNFADISIELFEEIDATTDTDSNATDDSSVLPDKKGLTNFLALFFECSFTVLLPVLAFFYRTKHALPFIVDYNDNSMVYEARYMDWSKPMILLCTLVVSSFEYAKFLFAPAQLFSKKKLCRSFFNIWVFVTSLLSHSAVLDIMKTLLFEGKTMKVISKFHVPYGHYVPSPTITATAVADTQYDFSQFAPAYKMGMTVFMCVFMIIYLHHHKSWRGIWVVLSLSYMAFSLMCVQLTMSLLKSGQETVTTIIVGTILGLAGAWLAGANLRRVCLCPKMCWEKPSSKCLMD